MLSKAEVRTWNRMVPHLHTTDPDRFRSSQRVVAPPALYVDMAETYAAEGGALLSHMTEDIPDKSEVEAEVDRLNSIMKKFADAVSDIGRAEETREAMKTDLLPDPGESRAVKMVVHPE